MWLLLASSAWAANLDVGQGRTYATITEAVAASADGDVLQIHPGYYDEGIVLVDRVLELRGMGDAWNTQLRPADAARALEIVGGQVTVSNVGVVGGSGIRGGGIKIVGGATVSLSGVSIDGSQATWGGGLYASDSEVTAVDLVVSDAAAELSGGAVYIDHATFDATGLVIEDAVGDRTWGSGLAATASTVTLSDGAIRRCQAARQNEGYGGGGLFVDGGSIVELARMVIEDNAAYTGGGVSVRGGSSLSVRDSVFARNAATDTGGAVDVSEAGSLLTEGTSFVAHSARRGGAIALGTGTEWLGADSWLEGNTAEARGGAVMVEWADRVDLDGVGLFDNHSGQDGGGMSVQGGVGVSVQNSLWAANTAIGRGGAAAVWGSGASFTSSRLTVTDNRADDGGGLYLGGVTGAVLHHGTYLANTAGHGSHVVLDGGDAHILNSLFAWGHGDGGVVALDSAAGSVRAHNAAWQDENGTWAGAWGEPDPGTGHVVTAPDLTQWSDDGDPTNDDWTPSPVSPLVDAGQPGTVDPDGSVADIGAWWQPDPFVIEPDEGDGSGGHPDGPDVDEPVDTGDPGDTGDDTGDPRDTGVPGPLPNWAGGGCVGGNAWLFVAPLALLLRRRTRPWALLALAGTASAEPPHASGLALSGGIGDATAFPHLTSTHAPEDGLGVALSVEHRANPLMEWGDAGREVVIGGITTASATLSLRAFERVRVDAVLPAAALRSGVSDGLLGTTDGRLGASVVLLRAGKLGLAAGSHLWLPTGTSRLGLGHRGLAAGGVLAFGVETERAGVVLNVGARYASPVPNRNIVDGSGPLGGVGVRWSPMSALSLAGELSVEGTSGAASWPVIARGSIRSHRASGFFVSGAAGAGLGGAVGAPTWSAGLQVGWATPPTPEPVVVEVRPLPKVVVAVPAPQPEAAEAPLAALVDNRIVLRENLFFREGKAELLDRSTPVLHAIVAVLEAHPEVEHLLVQGHTNDHGTAAVNRLLSQRRAARVVDWLVDHGIDDHRLLSKGYGFDEPLVPHDHPDAERLNRRVEFLVLRPDEVADEVRIPDEDELPSDER